MEPLPPADRFASHRPHNHTLYSAPKVPAQGPKLEIHRLGSHRRSARRFDTPNPPCSPHSRHTRPLVRRQPCQEHAPHHLQHPNQTSVLLLHILVNSRTYPATPPRSSYLPPHEKESPTPALASMARNRYFKAIQSAKRVHCSQFLADIDSRSVWDAREIAAARAPDRFPTLENASSPTEINNTLLQHFVPPRPSPPPPLILPAFKDVPPVLPSEMSSTLQKSSNTSHLARVVFLTLSGSESTRPMCGSFHLCSLPSSPTDTTPKA